MEGKKWGVSHGEKRSLWMAAEKWRSGRVRSREREREENMGADTEKRA